MKEKVFNEYWNKNYLRLRALCEENFIFIIDYYYCCLYHLKLFFLGDGF